MEKQQIVEKSVYTNLNGEVETKVLTNKFQKQYEILSIQNYKVIFRNTQLEIDKDAFKTAVDNEDGTYYFWHSGDFGEDLWGASFISPDDTITLASCGITITGVPQYKDSIAITLKDDEVSYVYMENTILFDDTDKKIDFVSFNCDEELEFSIGNYSPSQSKIIQVVTTRVELDLNSNIYGTDHYVGTIDVWNSTKKDVQTTLILAKKVKI